MEWVLMSERDLKRIEVLAQVDDGDLGVTTAAHLMNISRRHVYRLLDRFTNRFVHSDLVTFDALGYPPLPHAVICSPISAISLKPEGKASASRTAPQFKPTTKGESQYLDHGVTSLSAEKRRFNSR